MKSLIVNILPCLFIIMLMMASVLSRRLPVEHKTGERKYWVFLMLHDSTSDHALTEKPLKSPMTILHFTQFCPSIVFIHIDEIDQSGPVNLETYGSSVNSTNLMPLTWGFNL